MHCQETAILFCGTFHSAQFHYGSGYDSEVALTFMRTAERLQNKKNIEICRTQHCKRFLRSISKLNVSVKSEFVRFLWDHCELNMTSMRMRHLRSDRTSVESSWDEQNMDDCVDSRIGEDKGP